MSVKNIIKSIPSQSIDSSTFTGTFQAVNTSGLDHPCFLIRIVNQSNRALAVSYDGITGHDAITIGGTLEIGFQTNAQPNTSIANIPKGTIIYVSGLAAGTGLVYVCGYYQPQLN